MCALGLVVVCCAGGRVGQALTAFRAIVCCAGGRVGVLDCGFGRLCAVRFGLLELGCACVAYGRVGRGSRSGTRRACMGAGRDDASRRFARRARSAQHAAPTQGGADRRWHGVTVPEREPRPTEPCGEPAFAASQSIAEMLRTSGRASFFAGLDAPLPPRCCRRLQAGLRHAARRLRQVEPAARACCACAARGRWVGVGYLWR